MIGVFCSLFLVVFLLAFVYLRLFFKKAFSFFDDKSFPTLQPTFILGNLEDAILLRKPLGEVVYDLHKKLKPYKYAGLYWLHRPFVMLRDAELVRNALIRDFEYFPDRGIHCNEKEEPLNINMLRMRNAIHVIGSSAFGMDTMAMDNARSIFLHMGKRIFKFRYQPIVRHFFPNMSKFWLKMFDLRYLDKEVERFFLNMIKKVIKMREGSSESRNDLLDLLLALRTKNTDGSDINGNEIEKGGDQERDTGTEITTDLIIAQCYLFFAAGFETTSSGFSYLMLELALNQSIQNKAREEIRSVLENHNGQITHESLKEMTYCDMVILETLRKHPPAALLFRECSKSYQIPGTEAVIPEGTPVFISIYGLHQDPRYYEKPNEFYPEHFTKEARINRPKCCYNAIWRRPSYLYRFARMEIKIGMVNVIKDFILEVSPKMKFPMEYNFEMHLGLLSATEIWLQCKKV